jgi:predicted glycogen debranching enzyme
LPPPLIHLDRESLLDLERSLAREWLETDGLGGYASSTVLQCPTRRYHGLLVALPPGLAQRHDFLARLEETFHGGGKTFAISMARYPGLWVPLGHQGIERFELVPWPSWVYHFGSARLERGLMLVRGTRTVLVRYRVTGQRNQVELRLRPMLPFRAADALTFENEALAQEIERVEGGIRVRPYAALPALSIAVTGNAHFEADPCWYRQIEYRADSARGYEGREDNWTPGTFHVALEPGQDVFLAASIDGPVADPAALWNAASAARLSAFRGRGAGLRGALAAVAADFLYRREDGSTGVVAGWPWFGEWGRDTFLALPGLTLARGEIALCRDVLRGARRFLKHGLLPNVFGSGPEDSRYNSADASLWFARAVRFYERAAGAGSAREFLPALREIALGLERGEGGLLRLDEGGLLSGGSDTQNLTWMDACTTQGPVTPRAGCAVEIAALWYALLCHLAELEPSAQGWRAKAGRAGKSFLERFWLADERCLADVWTPAGADRSLRPNMVLAAALEWSPLSQEQRAAVVDRARAELVTPAGLRTLSPRDPAYVGRYAGGMEERDAAYHQGTVWPWLAGSYVEASLRAFGKERLEELRAWIAGFEPRLALAGLGHLAEVADGDEPHKPGGTIAQAWNTGELLRAAVMLESGRP